MNIKSAWGRFWFSESPYLDLAVLRFIVVAFSLFWLFHYTFEHLELSLGLNELLFSPIPALKILMLPFGWGAAPDAGLVFAVFWMTVITGALALVGLLTNFSMLLFALGNIFLQSYIYSFGDPHHREAIMNVTLLMFALAPCGRVLSVDSLLGHWRAKRRGDAQVVALLDYKGSYAGWAIRLMQCFFALMYLSAISSKLTSGGLDWANGYTLQYYMVSDNFRKGGIPFGLWMSQFHYFILGLQWVVVFFQATFFLVIFFPRLRWVYLPMGLAFHIGIYLTLHAPFPQWILLYALFVPWASCLKWLATATVPVTDAASSGAAQAAGVSHG